jgi:hypothetical protein
MMNKKRKRRTGPAATAAIAAWAIAIGSASVSVSAQGGAQAWRCGSTYSDRPCEGGRTVRVDDPRGEQERRAADAGTRSAQAQADQLERNRLAQEKAAYERDNRAAREARGAALAERRLALTEQRERERARKAAGDPRKSGMSFSGAARDKADADAPPRKKKKKKQE